MKTVGIICEFNPFHNGHVYFLKRIKEMYPDHKIVLAMSGNYTQRGELSLIDKWDKTTLALDYVDLVLEIPFPFTVQSADKFAYASITMLKQIGCDIVVFGSEDLDIVSYNIINSAFKNKNFDEIVRSYLSKGLNYPASLAKTIKDLTGINTNKGNDILGICYVKYLDNTPFNIIKRIVPYNTYEAKETISSGNAIRKLIKENKNIDKYIPKKTKKYLKHPHKLEDYYDFIKLKIISEIDHLDRYMSVDEGIENRIKKVINESTTLDELINKIKSKRYTYNRIRRMLIHIMCGYTKEDNQKYKELKYIKVLGFNKEGKQIIKKSKSTLPIITNYTKKYPMQKLELKINNIYYKNNEEYKHKPIKR